MTKMYKQGAVSVAVLALATLAAPASAQSGPAKEAPADEPVKDIVVTGSLIRGSSEEAPAPIDVINSEELARQGSPSVIDLINCSYELIYTIVRLTSRSSGEPDPRFHHGNTPSGQGNTIHGFQMNADGTLTEVSNSITTINVPIRTNPQGLAVL